MKTEILSSTIIVLVAAATLAHADTIVTTKGEKFENVTISRAEPDGLVISSTYGIIKIPFAELSPELQRKYHYDSNAAATFRKQLNDASAAREEAVRAAKEKHAQELAGTTGTPDNAPRPFTEATPQASHSDHRGCLGDTLPEIVQRFGPIIKREQSKTLPGEPGVAYSFEKNGFKITVRTVGGRVAWVLYMSEKPMFSDTVDMLLENNSEGASWSRGENTGDRSLRKEIHYNRSDGLGDADYQELGTYKGLCIITKAWRRARSPELQGM